MQASLQRLTADQQARYAELAVLSWNCQLLEVTSAVETLRAPEEGAF